MDNIVKVIFEPGSVTARISDRIYQYDYGQTLEIHGLDLPATVAVEYTINGSAPTIDCTGTTTEGIMTVPIPNAILEQTGDMKAYIRVMDSKAGSTEYIIFGWVRERAKPGTHNTPEEEELFARTIEIVNNFASSAEAARAGAEEARDQAQQTADSLEQTSAERLAQMGAIQANAQDYATQAGQSAQAAMSSERAAQMAQEDAAEILANAQDVQGEVNADSLAVAADRRQAEQLAAQTAADREQTGKDAVQTAADRRATGADKDSTAADRQAVAADRKSVVDTAAKALTDISTAKTGAVQAVEDNKAASVQTINDTGTAQVMAITDTGTKQITAIQSEGATQVQAVQEAAAEIIADRQQIQANTSDISALSAGLDVSATAIIRNASGSLIDISDSAGKPLRGMSVYGKSVQNITTGAQLYSRGDINCTWNSTDNNVNANLIQFGLQCGDVFQNGGFLSFYCDTDISDRVTIQLYGVSIHNWSGTVAYNIIKGLNKIQLPNYSFIEGQTTVSLQIRRGVIPFTYDGTFTLSKILVKAGVEEINWEPYTGNKPSPSPDYLQEIINTGDDGSIDVYSGGEGRNLALETSSEYSSGFSNFNGTFNTCIPLGNVLTDGLKVGDTATVHLLYKYENITPAEGKTAACFLQGYGDVTGWGPGTLSPSSQFALSGSGEVEILYSFNVTSSHLRNSHWSITIRNDYVQSGTVYYKMFKVERGNKATPWTPALEDITYENETELSPYITKAQFQTPNGLCGIPVKPGGNYTDSDGQQWICDEINLERGVRVQRVGTSDLKGLTWLDDWNKNPSYHIDGTFLIFTQYFNDKAIEVSYNLHSHFTRSKNILKYPNTSYQCGHGAKYNLAFRVPTSIASNVDEWKAYVDSANMTFTYVLAMPTETPLTEEELKQYQNLKTYPGTTHIMTDDPVEPEIAVEYVADTEIWTRNLLSPLEDRIATLEQQALQKI